MLVRIPLCGMFATEAGQQNSSWRYAQRQQSFFDPMQCFVGESQIQCRAATAGHMALEADEDVLIPGQLSGDLPQLDVRIGRTVSRGGVKHHDGIRLLKPV